MHVFRRFEHLLSGLFRHPKRFTTQNQRNRWNRCAGFSSYVLHGYAHFQYLPPHSKGWGLRRVPHLTSMVNNVKNMFAKSIYQQRSYYGSSENHPRLRSGTRRRRRHHDGGQASGHRTAGHHHRTRQSDLGEGNQERVERGAVPRHRRARLQGHERSDGHRAAPCRRARPR